MDLSKSLDGRPTSLQPQDFDPVAETKRLLRTVRTAALATLLPDGRPLVTLTTLATDPAGEIILLLSRLAAHTQNLEGDGRCSLLLSPGGRGDPLAHARLTLEADAAPTGDPLARRRFLRRNPKARLYADFADFSFWRAQIRVFQLNGGFARAAKLAPELALTKTADADALIGAEEDILDHLNADHPQTLKLLATAAGEADEDWRASGIDPDGLDLVAGDALARIDFASRVTTPQAVRATLVEMAAQARAQHP